MGKPLRFVSLPNLHRLLEGLAIDVPRCAEVLDHMLCGFDRMPGGIPSRIVAWNAKSPDRRGHLSFPGKGCIIAQVTQMVDDRGRVMHMSKLLTDSREPESDHAMALSCLTLIARRPKRESSTSHSCCRLVCRLWFRRAVHGPSPVK